MRLIGGSANHTQHFDVMLTHLPPLRVQDPLRTFLIPSRCSGWPLIPHLTAHLLTNNTMAESTTGPGAPPHAHDAHPPAGGSSSGAHGPAKETRLANLKTNAAYLALGNKAGSKPGSVATRSVLTTFRYVGCCLGRGLGGGVWKGSAPATCRTFDRRSFGRASFLSLAIGQVQHGLSASATADEHRLPLHRFCSRH